MANKVISRDITPNDFPKDYDRDDVDPRILVRTKATYEKKWASDVRESIGEGIEIAGTIAGESIQAANEANKRSKETEENLKNSLGDLTNDSEIKEARGGHKVLNDRLNEMDSVLSEVPADDRIRDLFKPLIPTMRENIQKLPGKVNLGHITDTHYVVRSNYWGKFPLSSYGYTHLFNFAAVSDLLNVAIAGGDNSDENTDKKYNIYSQQRDFATTFLTYNECPSFLGIGNHDTNAGHSSESKKPGNGFALTAEDFANLYFEKESLFGEVRNGNSNYFYYDIPDSNVRVIWIDLYQNPLDLGDDELIKYPTINTSIIQQDQIQWLAHHAFNTNRDVAVFTHCPLAGTFDKPTTTWFNHDVTMQLLKAFQTHAKATLTGTSAEFSVNVDCDFTENTGKIIGVFSGHKHRDDFVEKNDIKFILTNASVGQEFNGTSHWNTLDEDSFSVINIDETKRAVKIIKFGRGTGVGFNYE